MWAEPEGAGHNLVFDTGRPRAGVAPQPHRDISLLNVLPQHAFAEDARLISVSGGVLELPRQNGIIPATQFFPGTLFFPLGDLEARAGIEPAHRAFAELGLTTWLPRQTSRGADVAGKKTSRKRRNKIRPPWFTILEIL